MKRVIVSLTKHLARSRHRRRKERSTWIADGRGRMFPDSVEFDVAAGKFLRSAACEDRFFIAFHLTSFLPHTVYGAIRFLKDLDLVAPGSFCFVEGLVGGG